MPEHYFIYGNCVCWQSIASSFWPCSTGVLPRTLPEITLQIWLVISGKTHVLVQFGDASGIQSPVSFGGFGSLTRHLSRLTTGMVWLCFWMHIKKSREWYYFVYLSSLGIYEAVVGDFLDSESLSLLNPYLVSHFLLC